MIKISGDNSPTGDAYTDSLIFSAGSRLEMYKIREILKKKKFLVTQRSWLDTFPYRIAQGFTAKQVIHQLKPEGFRKPDIIFFLKCDHKTAYNRIKNKNGDKYEKLGPMKLHEKEFNNMINAILDNAFPIKFRNTKIFVVNSSESLTKMKKEVRMKLMDNKIIARDYK
jgi:thymidylate kinase